MSSSTPHPLNQAIAEYLAAFWPALPPQHIAMNARGPKYSWAKNGKGEYIPLDQATLLAHAAGRRTIGAYLHDASNQARIGMIDVDDGGRAALVRCLLAAEQLGLVAYAIVMPGEPHDGGRVVVAYKEFVNVDTIGAQMLAIVKLAGLPEDTEIWPRAQAVALPFAYHLRKRTRGELVLQTGESIALDLDLAAGFAAVRALPLNSAPPAIECELSAIAENRPAAAARPAAAHNISQAQPRQQGGRASLDDVKAKFNAEHAPDQLLLDYGAVQTSSKDFTCPFCKHSHTNTLFIFNGRIYSRSPGCIVPQKKGLDPFGLYCKVEHNDDSTAAAKKLNPIAPRKTRQEAPTLAPQPARQRTPEQIADADRKRVTTAARAAEIRASVEQRASQDDQLSDSGQLVLMALLDIAGKRSWCRPSVARIAEMITMSERSVFYGLRDLAKLGYIANSNAPGRTTVRTFLPLQAEQPNSGALHPDVIASEDLAITPVASEGGGIPLVAIERPAPAAQLEQRQVDYPGGASYSPPAAEPTGEYTGRVKDFQSFAEQWAVATSAIKIRPDVEPAPAEQQQLDEAPPSSAKPPRRPGRRAEISALDRYRADVALMSETQLAGELKKHQRTLKKHAGAVWLDDVRQRLDLVQAEIDQLGEQAPLGPPGAALRPPSQARRAAGPPQRALIAQQHGLFGQQRPAAAD